MIVSILAAGVFCTSNTHQGVGCGHASLPPKIEAIVEQAWSESATFEVREFAQEPAKTPQDVKLSKEEQRHQEDLKNDVALGEKYSKEADKELKASKVQEYIDRVNRLGQELADIANANKVEVSWGDKRLNTFKYTFKVVEGKEVNAFSLPGGFIYVYEGLAKYAESDDELAGVLAHEIAHASFRHLATLQREQSKLDALTLPLILASILVGSSDANAGTGLLTLGQLASQANLSGWSQKAEKSADYGAFQYIRKSPYNPTGLLTFMEKLARDQRVSESIDWGIYRTHPPSKERASALDDFIRVAGLKVQRSKVSTSFAVQLKPKESGEVQLEFNGRALFTLAGPEADERARSYATKLNHFFDEVPELYDVTLMDGATISWKQAPLIKFSEADALATGKTLEETSTSALKSLKRELYLLAYRIWDAR